MPLRKEPRMNELLIVVDYQNDFVDGSLGFPGAERLEDPICDKILAYKQAGQTVVFTLDTHEENYLGTREGRKLPVPHCLVGSKGRELYGRVRDLSEGCLLFEKKTFGSDRLFDYLREHSFDRIELVGLVSNICVLANAVLAGAASTESVISVDASCTASFDPSLHEKTLDVLSGIQVEVTNR